MELKERVALELDTARRRSLALLDPVSAEDQLRQHSPLMSPLIWDLAHVGNYEEIWLLRALTARGPTSAEYDGMYDASLHPRGERSRLRLLGPKEARSYVASVRSQVLDILEGIELDPAYRLLAEGYVYGMVVQHEQQHDETMLATLQLMQGEGYRPLAAAPPPGRPVLREEVLVDEGPFVMGTDTEAWAYDNERPAHIRDLAPFFIDTVPVTNRAFLAFVEDGGYGDPRHWSEAGWAWRMKAGAGAPQFWEREGTSWTRLRFGYAEPLPLDEPAQHVSWHEADAYARWRGKRLPTEEEWEKAASWDPRAGRKLRFPWGDGPPAKDLANLGQRHFRPAPAGAYPQGVSPYGCHQMIGEVWEWTSSDFQPYEGYEAFPYREYSEVFYGTSYKVLRGGSWATHPTAIRATFRNWDYPIRRQIFAGFRCARDA
ncbi:MAG: ergothioneine biosynthesis protein EgtB [Actinomycetota bacterium]